MVNSTPTTTTVNSLWRRGFPTVRSYWCAGRVFAYIIICPVLPARLRDRGDGRPPTASSASFSKLNLVPAEAADARPRGPAGYPLLLARFGACGNGEHPSRTPTRATLFRLKVYNRNFDAIRRCYLQQIFGCIPACRGGDNCDLGKCGYVGAFSWKIGIQPHICCIWRGVFAANLRLYANEAGRCDRRPGDFFATV